LAAVIPELDNVHVLLDSSGYSSERDFRKVVELCDMVYFDIKIMDKELHRCYTGVDNDPILRNLRILTKYNIPFVIRIPLVPGVTDTPKNLEAIASLASGLQNLQRVDLLPYNRAAGGKYAACGRDFEPIYDETSRVNADTSAFERLGIPVFA
jgi:pyruvate formate lyase activating enzyme